MLAVVLLQGGRAQAQAEPRESGLPTGVSFTYQDAVGLGGEAGVARRDPSDVIKVDGLYYVYYTYVKRAIAPEAAKRLYPSGYIGRIWCATSEDGKTWIERGEVLGLGKDGAFDSHAVFTPNILYHGGRYWLYYTGVKPTPGNKDGVFENNNTTDYTAIGLAVSDSPRGPFTRVSDQPVLTVGQDREDFDSYRVDDACLVVREGKVWLYYKGRSLAAGAQGPRKTRMGVAVADEPTGPYKKLNDGKPIQDSGHEVQVWRHGAGVMSLVSNTGPNGRTVQYAEDGLVFKVVIRDLQKMPHAPGVYRPELTDPDADGRNPRWGISMGTYRGDLPLVRYDLVWEDDQP